MVLNNEDRVRHVLVNEWPQRDGDFLPNNKIETAKYSILSFLPLFLFDQFSKSSNIYFLSISLLQQIPGLSPTGRWGTVTPLVLSLIVSAGRELIEDAARAREDESINLRKVLTIPHGKDFEGGLEAKPLKYLKVGQIVKVLRDEMIPADLVLVKSSEMDGLCYLETAAIDGESNLKLRQAHSKTNTLNNWTGCEITCDPPNNQIYTFNGKLEFGSSAKSPELPLGTNQFLPRGSTLVNTEWIIGIIVYTGVETKIMQNFKDPVRRKVTKMDRLNDFQNAQIVGILIVLVAVLFFGHVYFNLHILPAHEYLRAGKPAVNNKLFDSFWSYFANFITFLLLLNNLVPISLSVTLDLVRSLLSHLINNDLDMYDEETQLASKAQSSNVLDELGRIEYIMTDKTGTLTRNQMNLKTIMINDQLHPDCVDPVSHLRHILMSDNPSPATESIKTCLERIALCHTVMIDRRTGAYQASSPDELALLNAAKSLDCKFSGRTPDSMELTSFAGVIKQFALKAVIEFDSDRKRMSVVLQDLQTQQYFIVCKGADATVLPRCKNSISVGERCVTEFSLTGLRTLCFAWKPLTEEELTDWYKSWSQAMSTIDTIKRTALIESASEMIESGMDLFAVTGIEDELQEGVPLTVSTLKRANIRIWILTGDRAETATNTAHLSGLLQPHQQLIEILNYGAVESVIANHPGGGDDESNNSSKVLLVSGEMFSRILSDPKLRSEFARKAQFFGGLIACRLSPLQKSEITQFVQNDMKKTTLAIGDGGNDVGMIQVADVGVGINGLEGTQAARSADFSIPKFSFLAKLLLVHGSWSFHRISRVILYIMYKNIILVLCQFWYASMNSFSAQSAFSPFMLLLYNSLLSVAPPIIIGITDQYVTAPELLKHPQLYRFGQKGKFYDAKAFWEGILSATLQSFLLSLMLYYILQDGTVFKDAHPINLAFIGDLAYFLVLLIVSIKVILFTNYFTSIMSAALLSALFFCFLIIWSKSSGMLFQSLLFPAALLLVPSLVLLRDFLWKFYCRQFRPRAYHIVQEMRAVERRRARKLEKQKSHSKDKLKKSNSSTMANVTETSPLKSISI